eukprot:SAG31_NODE_3404_length_4312_cov_3.365773_2_plen_67_part_00
MLFMRVMILHEDEVHTTSTIVRIDVEVVVTEDGDASDNARREAAAETETVNEMKAEAEGTPTAVHA